MRAQDYTSETGSFTINAVVTAASDFYLPKNELSVTGETAFKEKTSIVVKTVQAGRIVVSSLNGKEIDVYELPEPGEYRFSYDGKNNIGMQIVSVQTKAWAQSVKLISTRQSGGTGLDLIHFNPYPNNLPLKSAEQDTLKISGENITTSYHTFWHEKTAVNVGQKKVNQGPESAFSTITNKVQPGQQAVFNMDNFVYNDEKSLYIPENENFIVDENLIRFSSATPGTYSTNVDVVDGEDTNLRKVIKLEVNVMVAGDSVQPEFTMADTLKGLEDEPIFLFLDESAGDNETSAENIDWNFTNGEFTVAGIDGRIAGFTPQNNKNGIDRLTATISDTSGNQNTKEIILYFEPVADKPVAGDDHFTTNYETGKTLNVLANDTDADNDIDAGKTKNITSPGNGTLSVNAGGTFDYSPNKGFEGTDFFEYEIQDNTGLKDSATVTITISSNPNSAPVFTQIPDDETNEDTPKTGVDVDNYLADDFTANAGLIFSITLHNPDLANVSLNANREIVFQPKQDKFGSTTVTITATDEEGLKDSTTFTFTVHPVNDLPEIDDLPDVVFNEDEVFTGPQIGVSDVEDEPGQLTLTAESNNENIHISIDGFVPGFSATANYYGSAIVTFTLSDSENGTTVQTINVTVHAVDDNPVANDDYVSTPFNTLTNISVAANDSDVDGDLDELSALVTANPGKGTTEVNQDGTVKYTPNDGASGQDSFGYKIKDDNGNQSNEAVVHVTIQDAQNPSINLPDHTIIQGEFVEIDADDYISDTQDPDGSLTLEQLGTSATSVTINAANHVIRYTVSSTQTGTDEVVLKVSDSDNNTATDTVRITAVVNNPPGASDYTIALNEDQQKTGTAFNVSDDHTNFVAIRVEVSGFTDVVVNVNPDTKIPTVTPNANIYGQRTGTVRFTDEQGKYTDILMTINIAAVNDPVQETASLQNQTTNEGETLIIYNWKNGLYDVENDPVNLVDVLNLNGSASVQELGANLEFTPADENYFGTISNIIIRVSDGTDISSRAGWDWTINNVPDAPVAQNDNATTPYETAVDIDVLSNDTDVENDINSNSVVIKTQSPDGTAGLNPNGTIRFVPDNGFSGTAAFTYSVKDNTNLESNIATVNIVVGSAPNQKPVANNDAATTDEDIAKIIYVLNNDTDDKGLNASSVNVIEAPSHGSTSVNTGDGSITYTPAADNNNNVTFKYEVADNEGLKDTATVSVTINPVDDSPRFSGTIGNQTNLEDVLLTFTTSNFTEPDGEAMNYQILNLPAGWSQSWSGNQVSITAPQDYNGTISGLVVEAKDPQNNSAQSNGFTITKTPVNDPVYTTGNIANIVLDKGNSTTIDLKNFFEDKETADADLIYTFAGLSLGTYSIANGVLTINATTAGTESDLRANASDGGTNVNGNYFSLTVNDVVQTSTVTFDFTSASKDTRLSSGTSTLQYRLPGGTWNTVTDTDGTVEVQLTAGQTYEVEVDHTSKFNGTYTMFALRRPGDNETFDQQDGSDKYQAITVASGSDNINAYIITSDFPLVDYYIYAGMQGSKKVHPNNEMTIWWNDNYTPSNAEQRTWIADIQTQVASIPFVTINLPFTESTTAPSGVYLEVKYNTNLGNSTELDGNNYIVRGHANYQTASPPSQRVFKVEIYQAMTDWQDSGGAPPFFDANGNINTTGKDVMAVSYLFRAGTLF